MDNKKAILVVGGGALGLGDAERLLSAQKLAEEKGAELVVLDASYRGPYKEQLEKFKDKLDNIADLRSPEPYIIRPRPEIPFMEMEDMKYGHLTKKQRNATIVPIRTEVKIYRNQPCPCGSGKKYKHCCANKK